MVSQLWHVMVRVQDEVATSEHEGTVVPHDGLGLKVEITEHFIRSPPAQKAYHVGVDMGAEKRHSARSPKAAGGDVGRGEAKGGRSKGKNGKA